jgi:hypothetical protein
VTFSQQGNDGLAGLPGPGGDWDRTDPEQQWHMVVMGLTDFTVTENHLKLLHAMHVQMNFDRWAWGSPCVSPRRPYGSSSVPLDIAEITGMDLGEDYADGAPMRQADAEAIARLQAETSIALQIALVTREFRAGRYLRGRYWTTWVPVATGSDGELERILLHLRYEHGWGVTPGCSPTLEELQGADPCRRVGGR